jgi:hypothetical protein
MLQKTNADGYVKDTETNVALNTNINEYNTYLMNKAKIKQSKAICEDIEILKKQVMELKTLIQQITSGTNNG